VIDGTLRSGEQQKGAGKQQAMSGMSIVGFLVRYHKMAGCSQILLIWIAGVGSISLLPQTALPVIMSS
jgi:hypothetical protein